MRTTLFIFIFCSVFSTAYSQSEALAKNYMEQGEYEKSLSLYQDLLEQSPRNIAYFQGVVSSHQELGNYEKSIELLLDRIQRPNFRPNLLVELGYNYQLQGNAQKAAEYYEKAIAKVSERPFHAYTLGKAFQKYNLLDQAVTAYETANEIQPNVNFRIQLARIYGEQGKLRKMFTNYVDLIEENPNLFSTVNRIFSQYITEDPLNDANEIFRKLLLTKLQENPNILYNQLLSWLFVQQKEYKKAFLQEKAIYMRGEGSLRGIFDLAEIVKSEKKPEIAAEILGYLIETEVSHEGKLKAHEMLLNMRVENSKAKEYSEIENEFSQLFAQYGKGRETLAIQLEEANFLAFQLNRKDDALFVLRNLLKLNLNRFQQAKVKLKLADILVLEEKFNQALIYYSQVQNVVKNDVLAQEARFKVANTSYYKGDFDWALTQLDVLKASTSQLIANDAMELSLMIRENSLEDSTQTALKLFARADLAIFQEKNHEALAVFNQILSEHQNEKIIDDVLFGKATLLLEQDEYERAISVFEELIVAHKESIWTDNAYFALAELYREKLNLPLKAKEYYEKILFGHEDSIYFVEARKRYRELRGELIE